MTSNQNSLNVTLPAEIIGRIDKESKEKDMSRSRYVLRLIEKAYGIEQKKEIQ
ncbi:MAG TPA: hypothetical protein VH415_11585 [Nitrososphaeraceae archaeon]|jgi:hypothetical protein